MNSMPNSLMAPEAKTTRDSARFGKTQSFKTKPMAPLFKTHTTESSENENVSPTNQAHLNVHGKQGIKKPSDLEFSRARSEQPSKTVSKKSSRTKVSKNNSNASINEAGQTPQSNATASVKQGFVNSPPSFD